MILTYVDNCIIMILSMKDIDSFIHSMQNGLEIFIFTDKGDVNMFLGIEINKNKDSSFELSQPFLIDRLLSVLGLSNNEFETNPNMSSTPVAKGLLHRYLSVKPLKLSWKYCTDVGLLPYLQGHTRPDISIASHLKSRFCNNPMLIHEKAVMRLRRYPLGTRSKGIIYNPDKSKGL